MNICILNYKDDWTNIKTIEVDKNAQSVQLRQLNNPRHRERSRKRFKWHLDGESPATRADATISGSISASVCQLAESLKTAASSAKIISSVSTTLKRFLLFSSQFEVFQFRSKSYLIFKMNTGINDFKCSIVYGIWAAESNLQWSTHIVIEFIYWSNVDLNLIQNKRSKLFELHILQTMTEIGSTIVYK